MDLNKRSKITNTAQFARMVELLEQNPNLARGYSSGVDKKNVKEEWNKIGVQLNILGPPTRTGEGWTKVWADYKFKIKKKLVHNKAECRATGGGPFKQFVLSPTEEAAANLLKMNTIVNPGGISFGFPHINKENDCNETNIALDFNMESEEPFCSQILHNTSKELPPNNNKTTIIKATQNNEERSYSIPKIKTPTRKTSKSDLLEEQLNVQTDLYKKVNESLSEIKRYQRKNYNLKEEKLKLYKEELKRKNEYRREFLKLRKEELEIKRRRVELDEIRNGI